MGSLLAMVLNQWLHKKYGTYSVSTMELILLWNLFMWPWPKNVKKQGWRKKLLTKSGNFIITFDNLQRKFEIFLILKNLTNFFLQNKSVKRKWLFLAIFYKELPDIANLALNLDSTINFEVPESIYLHDKSPGN